MKLKGNNHYLYFFLKLLLLVAVTGIFDQVIGHYLNYYYFRQHTGVQYRTTVAMEKTKAQVLVFGSSRANHHYYPPLFEKKLNKTFYNAGRDAEFIFYHFAVLKSLVKRYRPELIILDFQRGEFLRNQESYDKLSALFPYYAGHPEIRPVINLKGPYEKIKLLSGIYPFNSALLSIIAGNVQFSKSGSTDEGGYVPLYKTASGPLEYDPVKQQQELDTAKIRIYNSFIDTCKELNIPLVIVCSPYYIRFRSTDQSVELAREIASRKGVDFYDFSNESFFLNQPRLFNDQLHLNNKGAIEFTGRLLDTISKKSKPKFNLPAVRKQENSH